MAQASIDRDPNTMVSEYKDFITAKTKAHSIGQLGYSGIQYDTYKTLFDDFGKTRFVYKNLPFPLSTTPSKIKTADDAVSSYAQNGLAIVIPIVEDSQIHFENFAPGESNQALELLKTRVYTDASGVCPFCEATTTNIKQHYKHHVYVKYFTTDDGHMVYGYDYSFACTKTATTDLYTFSDMITLKPNGFICHACPSFAHIDKNSKPKNKQDLINRLEGSDWQSDANYNLPVTVNPLAAALKHLMSAHYSFYCLLFNNMVANINPVSTAGIKTTAATAMFDLLGLAWPGALEYITPDSIHFDTVFSTFLSQFLHKSVLKMNGRYGVLNKGALMLNVITDTAETHPTEAEMLEVTEAMDTAAAAAVQALTTEGGLTEEAGMEPSAYLLTTGEEEDTDDELLEQQWSQSEDTAIMPPPPQPFQQPSVVYRRTSEDSSELMKPPSEIPPRKSGGKSRRPISADTTAVSGVLHMTEDDEVLNDDLIPMEEREELMRLEMSATATRSLLSSYPFSPENFFVHTKWSDSVYDVPVAQITPNNLYIMKASKGAKHVVALQVPRILASKMISFVTTIVSYEASLQLSTERKNTDKCWWPVVSSITIAPVENNPANVILIYVVENPIGYTTAGSVVDKGTITDDHKKKMPFCMLQGFTAMADEGMGPLCRVDMNCFLVNVDPKGGGHCISLLPLCYAPVGLSGRNLSYGNLDVFYLIAGCMTGLSKSFLETKGRYSDTNLPADADLTHPNIKNIKNLIEINFNKTAGRQILAMSFPANPIFDRLSKPHVGIIKNTNMLYVSMYKPKETLTTDDNLSLWRVLVMWLKKEPERTGVAELPKVTELTFEDYSTIDNPLADLGGMVPDDELGPAREVMSTAAGMLPPMPAVELRDENEMGYEADLEPTDDADARKDDEEDEDIAITMGGKSKRGRKKLERLPDEIYESAMEETIGGDMRPVKSGGAGAYNASVDVVPMVMGTVLRGSVETAAIDILREGYQKKSKFKSVETGVTDSTGVVRVKMSKAGVYGQYAPVPLCPRTALEYRTIIKGPVPVRAVQEWDIANPGFFSTPDLTAPPDSLGDYQVYVMWYKSTNTKGPHNYPSMRPKNMYIPRFDLGKAGSGITLTSGSLIRSKNLWFRRIKIVNSQGFLPNRWKEFIKHYADIHQAVTLMTSRKHFTRTFVTFFDTPGHVPILNGVVIMEPLGDENITAIKRFPTKHASGIIKCIYRAIVLAYKSSKYLIHNILPGYIWYNESRKCYTFDVMLALCDCVFMTESLILAVPAMGGCCRSFSETIQRLGLMESLSNDVVGHLEKMRRKGRPKIKGWKKKTMIEKLYHLGVALKVLPTDTPIWREFKNIKDHMGDLVDVNPITIPNTLGRANLALIAPASIRISKMRFAWDTAVAAVPLHRDTPFFGLDKNLQKRILNYHKDRLYCIDDKLLAVTSDKEDAEINKILPDFTLFGYSLLNQQPTGSEKKRKRPSQDSEDRGEEKKTKTPAEGSSKKSPKSTPAAGSSKTSKPTAPVVVKNKPTSRPTILPDQLQKASSSASTSKLSGYKIPKKSQ